MRLAIMQPYFFPYIGYFQLMNVVDEFVVYDNIEFTKKGWINRNRILVNGKDDYITLPLKKDSDFLFIKDRYLSETWVYERKKILNKIRESYRKAKCFNIVYPVIEKVFLFEENNLFKFILNSLNLLREYLDIQTPLIVSSTLSINHELKSETKVIAICKERNADAYLNPIGGLELYRIEHFKNDNINLNFLKTKELTYQQINSEFIPSLSIIDVMMFNSKEEIKEFLNSYYTII